MAPPPREKPQIAIRGLQGSDKAESSVQRVFEGHGYSTTIAIRATWLREGIAHADSKSIWSTRGLTLTVEKVMSVRRWRSLQTSCGFGISFSTK